jgi:hypothetical protein
MTSASAWLSLSNLWLVCLAGFVAVESVSACRRAPPDPPRFPHEVHLAKLECGAPGQPACLTCRSCHAEATGGQARTSPQLGTCARCHRDDSGRLQATLARTPERPYGEISIDHDKHLALESIRGQCVPCHAGVVDANRPALPPMSQCFTCHEHEEQWNRGQCTPCHEPRDLAKTLPVTFLRHDEAFSRRHGDLMAQGQNAQLCQSCHTQAQCQACHDLSQQLSVEARRPEKIESRMVHQGDFLVRHAVEAESQPARCLSCHTPETCDSCHVARGVSANRAGSPNPHPPGWVGTNTLSSDFHGVAARRDILSCASCHEAGPATNCIQCHRVGAYGGNPHPNGWSSGREPSNQMCRYCHE